MSKNKKKAPTKSDTVMNIITVVLIVLIIAAACVFVYDKIKDNRDTDGEPTGTTSTDGEYTSGDGGKETDDKKEEVESVTVDFTKEYTATHYVEMEFEALGTVKLELDATKAPITVENFVKLAKSGFYDGLTIHRAQDGFVIQGGDPLGNGYGGSDESIKGEFAANGVANPLTHTRGAISMARSEDPNSASSQFFIVQEDIAKESLDGLYAAFGYVVEGMEIVDKICLETEPAGSKGMLAKEDQPVIKKVTVTEK